MLLLLRQLYWTNIGVYILSKYIIRLDDACEKRDIDKWNRIETILDKYNVKPLVGIIPNCEDPMMDVYSPDKQFWGRVHNWSNKGWTIALHGYNHVYATHCGGINPVNKRSEFAGESLAVQKDKIRKAMALMRGKGIEPMVFFAPSHTFDENTILALKEESAIRIISDTIANDSYTEYGMTFVPQQSGRVRPLPFNMVTFCYHPNAMIDEDFERLEKFLMKYKEKFIPFPVEVSYRKRTYFDKVLRYLYFARR